MNLVAVGVAHQLMRVLQFRGQPCNHSLLLPNEDTLKQGIECTKQNSVNFRTAIVTLSSTSQGKSSSPTDTANNDKLLQPVPLRTKKEEELSETTLVQHGCYSYTLKMDARRRTLPIEVLSQTIVASNNTPSVTTANVMSG